MRGKLVLICCSDVEAPNEPGSIAFIKGKGLDVYRGRGRQVKDVNRQVGQLENYVALMRGLKKSQSD